MVTDTGYVGASPAPSCTWSAACPGHCMLYGEGVPAAQRHPTWACHFSRWQCGCRRVPWSCSAWAVMSGRLNAASLLAPRNSSGSSSVLFGWILHLEFLHLYVSVFQFALILLFYQLRVCCHESNDMITCSAVSGFYLSILPMCTHMHATPFPI